MILIYLLVALVAFVLYVKWRQSYWSRRNVPTPAYEFLLGNIRDMISSSKSIGEGNLEIYKKLKQHNIGYAGMYFFLRAVFVPLDPKLIKLILQKDFNHFMSHGVYHDPKDILSMNLFNLEGDKWKDLRAKLTPTFTSGKMKMMFETLLEKALVLEDSVGRYATSQEPFVIKEVLGRFTTDVIGSCAFGIECNSLVEPDNTFRSYGKKMLVSTTQLKVIARMILSWPMVARLNLGTSKEISQFFIKLVKDTIKYREENDVYRKDFMHLLLELKNQNKDGINKKQLLTDEDIFAQCFIFFFAGFETSSTTMTFALLELSRNEDIQEKLRSEIRQVLEKHGGQVTYEAIMEMTYLDQVINETLRRYPPVPLLPRRCTKDYPVPGTNLVINKGTSIIIPVWGIQMDTEYYPNPDVFDPDRFAPENKAKRPEFTFLPFGEGPRMCIGLRFGMLQSKAGLVACLRNFRFTLNERTQLPIRMAPTVGIPSVKGDVWVDAIRI